MRRALLNRDEQLAREIFAKLPYSGLRLSGQGPPPISSKMKWVPEMASTSSTRKKGQLMRNTARSVSSGLFPAEDEIARKLSKTPSEWRAVAILLERDGFPRVDPIMGGRYWPAVIAWFNNRYGITSVGPPAVDGTENLDAL